MQNTSIVLALILGYILAGIRYVMADLSSDPVNRPLWAFRPSTGKAVLMGALWVTRPLFHFGLAGRAQSIAAGIGVVAHRWLAPSLMFWALMALVGLLTPNILIQAVAAFISYTFLLAFILRPVEEIISLLIQFLTIPFMFILKPIIGLFTED